MAARKAEMIIAALCVACIPLGILLGFNTTGRAWHDWSVVIGLGPIVLLRFYEKWRSRGRRRSSEGRANKG